MRWEIAFHLVQEDALLRSLLPQSAEEIAGTQSATPTGNSLSMK
jgi:hypothetical protein